MNPISILAASYLGSEGYGNDRTGLRAWPPAQAEALQRGDLAELHWSHVLTTEMPRFGRMDIASRLGLMAVELLDAGFGRWGPSEGDAVGVCVETRSGSTSTDWRFLQTPLASTFAYTLPSAVIGEICIRHRFRGPVMCLLPGTGRSGALETARGWLERGEADACVCVAYDVPDKEIAISLPWAYAGRGCGWQGSALWMGKAIGQERPYPWRDGPVHSIALALCLQQQQQQKQNNQP